MAQQNNREAAATAGSAIADEIRKDIANKLYKMGDKIKEAELCKKYGVSRTPVREAFRLLQNEGLLVYIPQRGVQVANIGADDTNNLIEIRICMECLSAREAAKYITDDEIAKLRQMNADIRAFDEKNATHSVELDSDFHITIAKAGHNPYISEYLENILRRNMLVKYVVPPRRERIPHTYKEHEDIIDALSAHDPFLAEEYMKIHFHNSMRTVEAKIQNYIQSSKKEK